jgi:hypothetical protein
MSLNLLIETSTEQDFDYIVEENTDSKKRNLYIKGVFMEAEKVNKNNRVYPIEEMTREVDRYIKEMVGSGRAMGELNHPTNPDVDLGRACHMVTELKQEGKQFIGKSKVLSTPCGQIVESLISDGVKVGMSTRSLGKLVEEGGDGVNKVADMRLVAIDCVADPSCSDAFVNGILENKQWICDNSGTFVPFYETFEQNLSKLPRKSDDLKQYITQQITQFINKL